MRLKPILAAALLAAAIAGPAGAQTVIEAPANASWKHAGSGMILRSKLAGYARGQITDNSKSELDVMVPYRNGDRTEATIYVFRPALMSVPVWFDRSETQILARDIFAGPSPLAPALAFAPPRATAASGLRRVYVPGKGPIKATGLAMMPLGEWLVAVRISSLDLDPSALDAKLSEIVAGLGWPEGVAEAKPAAPIAPCDQALAYDKKAKLKKPDMTDALLGATLMGVVADKAKIDPDEMPVLWCREGAVTAQYGVYRANGSTSSYTMALGDAGLAINVSQGFPLDDKPAGYMLTLGQLDRTLVYPSFDRLPSPDKAYEAVRKTSPISSASRGGKDITINADATK